MKKFLWFHAFRRPTTLEILEVLLHGPKTHPDPGVPTQQNERELGLSSSVYAYLGRTIEAFGESAFVLPAEALTGTVSPFDTGGIIKYHQPVATWNRDDRRKFVQENSWSTSNLARRLKEYPGDERVERSEYVSGERPEASGPAAVWRTSPPADIWRNPANDWRAWTWEIRVRDAFPPPVADLVYWTCPAHVHSEIFEHLLSSGHPDGPTVLSKYYDGGVSRMVEMLRARQV